MRVKKVEITNFRLLRQVVLGIEDATTLIVGRNNSGKTSIAELFRRLLGDKTPTFRLEDFSLGSVEGFWTAYQNVLGGQAPAELQAQLPTIGVAVEIAYDVNAPDLGDLGDCIVDLDPACSRVRLVMSYSPRPESLATLLADIAPIGDTLSRQDVFHAIADRIPAAYAATLEAVDPNDPTNRRPLDFRTLSAVVRGGFITAQRGLDDVTHRERDVLGKIVEVLFKSALNDPDAGRRTTAEELQTAVRRIQATLNTDINGRLNSLLPAFELFGYPSPLDPGLTTETNLDIDRLLSDHTKMRYVGVDGMSLPETYNGLGIRNLVFILLQLLRFFREYQAAGTSGSAQLIFIEEPEAHLHPQVQEVFIRQLARISEIFAAQLNAGRAWPVQFIVSTHSPHMANEAPFSSVRYFLTVPDGAGIRRAEVRDLRQGTDGFEPFDIEFLHQYLTLTRCDLFFADKAILIEGTAERLLLPVMMSKVDQADPRAPQLRSQYITVMEVGGAYAHRFFDLLTFLDLRALVVTDIDTVHLVNRRWHACRVAEGERTSNACLKEFFGAEVTREELLAKTPEEKTANRVRVAYQVPEANRGPCGRSFEDAFILANSAQFTLGDGDPEEAAYSIAGDEKKSAFALKYAIEVDDWQVPRYIAEGLAWLAQGHPTPVVPEAAVARVIETVIDDATAPDGATGA